MRKKSIAYFCPLIYPCNTGGLEVFTYYLIKEICKNQEVFLFTKCKNFQENNIVSYPLFSRLLLFRNTYFIAISQLICLIFYLLKIKNRIRLFHVPHTNRSDSYGLIFPFLKFLFRIEYVVVLHGGNIKKFKNTFLNQLLFKHAKSVIAVSESSADDYKLLINREIEIIPSLTPFHKTEETANDLKTKYQIPTDSKVIIMVGSIKPLKGNTTVLEAFNSFGMDYILKNNLHLVFAGHGIDENNLKHKTLDFNLKNHVHFLGNIDNAFIHEIYSFADIYVIASWFESLSKTMLEAMSNALPIIASDVHVINKLIKNEINGLLFEVNNWEELSKNIKILIANPEFAAGLGFQAKKYFNENFEYNKIINQYKSIYNIQ
jgi:glycosyltransferase involved in cell wall biosynthesis